jgi:hypothetical protein
VNRGVGLLIGGCLAFWGLLVYPAYLMWGRNALVHSATAATICLLPTLATFLWASWAKHHSPGQQFLVVLGGTGARMAFVLLASLTLTLALPDFRQPTDYAFWIWVLAFYLFTLALEVTLLVKDQQPADSGA